jgi:hypothetical protein
VVEVTTPLPRHEKFEIVSLIALVLAGLWCAALLIGAMTVPVYSGSSSSGSLTVPATVRLEPSASTMPTGTTSGRATLVEVNGLGVLGVVAAPAIPVLVVAGALWARHRAQRRGAGAVAWATVGVLGMFALVGVLSIGMFVVPIAVLLTISCAMTNAPPRPARTATNRSRRWELPSTATYVAMGGAVAAALGGVVGLVLGLSGNPATAWFAALGVGIPAAVLGGCVGLLTSALVSVGRWLGRRF